MKKPTPQDIYQEAWKERAKPDPLKKRQTCEKGRAHGYRSRRFKRAGLKKEVIRKKEF